MKDCESKYGSKVNNITLVANEDTPLRTGDRLFLGTTTEMRQVYGLCKIDFQCVSNPRSSLARVKMSPVVLCLSAMDQSSKNHLQIQLLQLGVHSFLVLPKHVLLIVVPSIFAC